MMDLGHPNHLHGSRGPGYSFFTCARCLEPLSSSTSSNLCRNCAFPRENWIEKHNLSHNPGPSKLSNPQPKDQASVRAAIAEIDDGFEPRYPEQNRPFRLQGWTGPAERSSRREDTGTTPPNYAYPSQTAPQATQTTTAPYKCPFPTCRACIRPPYPTYSAATFPTNIPHFGASGELLSPSISVDLPRPPPLAPPNLYPRYSQPNSTHLNFSRNPYAGLVKGRPVAAPSAVSRLSTWTADGDIPDEDLDSLQLLYPEPEVQECCPPPTVPPAPRVAPLALPKPKSPKKPRKAKVSLAVPTHKVLQSSSKPRPSIVAHKYVTEKEPKDPICIAEQHSSNARTSSLIPAQSPDRDVEQPTRVEKTSWKSKKRKSVTWADLVDVELTSKGLKKKPMKDATDDSSDDGIPLNVICNRNPALTRHTNSTQATAIPESSHPLQPPDKGSPLMDLDAKDTSVSFSSSVRSEITTTSAISGWDSDLSELTATDDSDSDSSSSDEETTSRPTNLTIRLPARPPMCSNSGCRHVLPRDYRWKWCAQCRFKSRKFQFKRHGIEGTQVKRISPGSPQSHDVDAGSEPSGLGRVVKQSTIPPFTTYKCRSALVEDFQSQLKGFLEARDHYAHYKQSKTFEDTNGEQFTSRFMFSGEFSVVALDFNVSEVKDAVIQQLYWWKEQIASIKALQLSSKCWLATLNEEGIAGKFRCQYPAPHSPSSEFWEDRVEKPMRGELETAMLPDYTHPLFTGHRTIVRFCLVG